MACDCLIDVYHANTWSHAKEMIVSSLKNVHQSTKRIIIASTALSMGVNFPDIEYIINWGPPRTLLDYHQEAGRAGRDGRKAHSIVTYHGQMAAQCETDVKEFIRSTDCLRVASLLPLDKHVEPHLPGHDCCSHCHSQCKCDGDSCTVPVPSHESEQDVTSNVCKNPVLVRSVTLDDKSDLKSALEELAEMFNSQGSIVLNTEDQTGIIEDLVRQSTSIFTVKDIVQNFPILSLQHVIKILEVFNEIFEDIECVDEILTNLIHDVQFEQHSNIPDIESAPFEDAEDI
ncbi:Hypothetical predicted protein [Paramuricea clavata]|uniref:DNA 3'-5' helicase n=1 Tax=Paramuricea clavata TaxID=317549 RepID=A0A7D9EK53_PARCT|nr:Hypothetical predicted protein [Paramuricea clavata]